MSPTLAGAAEGAFVGWLNRNDVLEAGKIVRTITGRMRDEFGWLFNVSATPGGRLILHLTLTLAQPGDEAPPWIDGGFRGRMLDQRDPNDNQWVGTIVGRDGEDWAGEVAHRASGRRMAMLGRPMADGGLLLNGTLEAP